MQCVLVSGKAGSGKSKRASQLYWDAAYSHREVTLYDEGKLLMQNIPRVPDPSPLKISTAVSSGDLCVEMWYV